MRASSAAMAASSIDDGGQLPQDTLPLLRAMDMHARLLTALIEESYRLPSPLAALPAPPPNGLQRSGASVGGAASTGNSVGKMLRVASFTALEKPQYPVYDKNLGLRTTGSQSEQLAKFSEQVICAVATRAME